MLIKIISIGNKLNSWESESIQHYKKQMPKNFKIDFINLKSQQNPKYSKKEVIKKESELLISKILENEFVVACDSMGELADSGEFSCLLKSCQEMNKTISFNLQRILFLSFQFRISFSSCILHPEQIPSLSIVSPRG